MRPSFEEINMQMAALVSRRSTCKRLSVGCVITSTDFRKVLSVGYNGNASGLPNTCDSDEPGACGCLHSEVNAVINCDAPRSVEKIVFITALPCPVCAKVIINLGNVRKVYYAEDYRIRDGLSILTSGGIPFEQLKPRAVAVATSVHLRLIEQRRALWALLDNIDTLDDASREDDLTFRRLARVQQQKRFDIWDPDDSEVMTEQQRVAAWVRETLGGEALQNTPERALRTVEEVLELAQACGVGAEMLHKLVDYVLARPVGDAAQEIAGCLVTLYSVAETLDVDAKAAFEEEILRIQRPEIMDKVRRRQKEKREALVGDLK
jgi:deoxycytidylate deaminase/NTP pyrophosphatase (non-canonical NTP hydrolase)